jgi:hypothetical protein
MVVVLQIQICDLRDDDEMGQAIMRVLAPEQRLEVFRACEWLREHPNWDRVTYENRPLS